MSRFEEHAKSVLVAFVGSLVIFVLVDLALGHSARSSGVVIDKIYIQERIYPVTRSITDGNGHTRYYTTIERDPPEWKFVVKDAGNTLKVNCRQEVYYNTKIGQDIPFSTRYGKWTKLPYFCHAL